MARLSTPTRERMALALVRHRFADRADALIAESKALFHAVYDNTHTAAVRKHMAALEKAYKGAFGKGDELDVNVDGRRFKVGSRSIAGHWCCQAELLPLLRNVDSWPGVGFAADDELGARLITFADAERKLKEDGEVAMREALGALAQFSTGKRLAEDWPEALPIIGDLIPEDSRTLPVVQVANLNSKFDLPPASKAA